MTNQKSNYWMKFEIKGMDVVVHRYKRNIDNCIQNWKNYDAIALEQITKPIGCKAPYQKTILNWPICNSTEKMKKVIKHHQLRINGIVPCREIVNIRYTASDSVATEEWHVRTLQGKRRKRWFAIAWTFLDYNFIKTTNKKEVDLQSLIGWIGGYIGMFTGLALSQLPELLFAFIDFLTRLRKRFSRQDSNQIEMFH